MIVGWLAFQQLAATGPLVTVIFPAAGGIEAGNTSVNYQGLKVGSVETVKLEKDLKHVRVGIRMNEDMEGHLGKGTQFWIAGPSISDLSSIKSIISGPSIGISPRSGDKLNEYAGATEAPETPEMPGTRYILHASKLGTISHGSQIYYRDLAVGKVEDAKLQPDRSFEITVFVKVPYNKLVHDGTRFWSADAVQLSLQGNGPRVQLQSIASLIMGGLAFDTPAGARQEPQAQEDHAFTLYDGKEEALSSPGRGAVLYRAVFGADAGGLADGAAVTLAAKQVGAVQHSALEYDTHTGKLEQQVTFSIEHAQIALAGASWPAEPRQEMNTVMQRLIAQGLRAELGSSIPMVGPKDVELTFVHNAPAATLSADATPMFPTASGGSGLQGAMTAVNNIANKINGVPLDQIADNIRSATGRLAEFSQSPKLTQSLSALNRSLANVDQVTASAKTQLPAMLTALRQVAHEAQGTVADARHLIASTAGQGASGVDSTGLSRTLYELSRAAMSVRELADYLDRHPSALIRGRS